VVQSGLKSGDKIVIEGVGNLKPGIAIKPVPANTDSLYADAQMHTTTSLKHK
jgi:membrane fusion protein (multidrug efflux system)